MHAYYIVSVTYPNGKTEEIEDVYHTVEDAIEFGEQMLAQIPANAGFHSKSHDVFGDETYTQPYFLIKKVDGSTRTWVYDSRSKI